MFKNRHKGIVCTLLIILSFSMIFNSGCATKNPENNGKVSVYTSFYVMYDLTKKIGGDKINLENLVPAGVEPHDWEPAPSDMISLEKADLFVYNGAGMEGWADKVLGSISNKKLVVVEASKGITLTKSKDKNEDLAHDPHVWLNPINAKKEMENIKNALVNADPANKNYYENNYEKYLKEFDLLDKEYKDMVSKITKKDIVVAHEAFGYLCNAYGLNQVAIEGLNAESEPSPGRMAEIVDFVKKNKVKYIFFEELVSPKVAQVIAKESGAKTSVLNPLEGLMEEDINQGKEYFSVMRDNLSALREALK